MANKFKSGTRWLTRDGRTAVVESTHPDGSFSAQVSCPVNGQSFITTYNGDGSRSWGNVSPIDIVKEEELNIVNAADLNEPADDSTSNVLKEALAVAGDNAPRARDYGTPYENHMRIARYWNAHRQNRKDPNAPLRPDEVAEMMVLLKIARQQNTPKRDNLVDIAGYDLCLESILKEMERLSKE